MTFYVYTVVLYKVYRSLRFAFGEMVSKMWPLEIVNVSLDRELYPFACKDLPGEYARDIVVYNRLGVFFHSAASWEKDND